MRKCGWRIALGTLNDLPAQVPSASHSRKQVSKRPSETFLTASIALLLVPGPAVLYIMTRSIDQGRAAGLASVAGIESATFVHILAAALGLSAILVSSALAFDIVKYIGAAYLIYLGVSAFCELG